MPKTSALELSLPIPGQSEAANDRGFETFGAGHFPPIPFEVGWVRHIDIDNAADCELVAESRVQANIGSLANARAAVHIKPLREAS